MGEYQRELDRIKSKVDYYEQEKRKIENVVDLIHEGSQYSEGLIEVVREKEAKILDLEKKRAELNMLNKVASENNDEIENLKKSIEVMKHQRTELQQMAEDISNTDAFLDPQIPSHIDYDHEGKGLHQRQIDEPPAIERQYNLENQVHPRYSARQYDSEYKRGNFDKVHESSDLSVSLMNEDTPPRNNTSVTKSKSQNKDKDEILKLKNEIADLKLMLVEKEIRQSRLRGNIRLDEGLHQVPTTLTLFQSAADELSVLGDRSVLGESRKGRYQKVRPSISSVEFEKLRRQIYDTESVERRWVAETNSISVNHPEAIYDLGATERHRNRRSRKARREEEEEISCEDVCAGPLYVVKILRNLFKRRDPVLRRW